MQLCFDDVFSQASRVSWNVNWNLYVPERSVSVPMTLRSGTQESQFLYHLTNCRYVYLLVLERVILFQYLSQRTADRSKSIKYNDFRGITISPVISKIFEHCLMNGFQIFFNKWG